MSFYKDFNLLIKYKNNKQKLDEHIYNLTGKLSRMGNEINVGDVFIQNQQLLKIVGKHPGNFTIRNINSAAQFCVDTNWLIKYTRPATDRDKLELL